MDLSVPAIEKVPFEIWGKIFEFSLHHAKRPEIKLSPTEAPISVSQTCFKWRQIALDVPPLWSTITFTATREVGAHPHPGLVDLWLQRSRKFPLSINIRIIEWKERLSPGVFECLLQIFRHVGRWKTAKINMHSAKISRTGVLSKLQSELQGKVVPLLKLLELDIKPNAAHDDPLLPTNLWTNAPRLLRLKLGLEVDMHSVLASPSLFELDHVRMVISSNIPFPQITHLNLDLLNPVMVRDLNDVFQNTPNLVSCFIGGKCAAYFLPPGAPPAVTLQHLKYLGLRCIGTIASKVVFKEILNQIVAPSLQTFCFVGISASQVEIEAYTSFISRSSCRLEELMVVESHLQPLDLIRCLQLSPSLKTLHLDGSARIRYCPLLDRALTHWEAETKQFTLCPLLRQISISHIPVISDAALFFDDVERHEYEEEVTLLIRFFQTRLCPPYRSPQIFTTFVSCCNEADLNPRLLELCEPPTGLKVFCRGPQGVPNPRDLLDRY